VGFAAPMTAPERVVRAALIFAVFLPPRAIWTPKEVADWKGLFTTKKS
jgi:hypothetical protein